MGRHKIITPSKKKLDHPIFLWLHQPNNFWTLPGTIFFNPLQFVYLQKKYKKNMVRPPKNTKKKCHDNGDTIQIGQEIQCLFYAVLFLITEMLCHQQIYLFELPADSCLSFQLPVRISYRNNVA